MPSSSKRSPVKSGPPRTPVEKPEATKIASNDTIFASLRKLFSFKGGSALPAELPLEIVDFDSHKDPCWQTQCL